MKIKRVEHTVFTLISKFTSQGDYSYWKEFQIVNYVNDKLFMLLYDATIEHIFMIKKLIPH